MTAQRKAKADSALQPDMSWQCGVSQMLSHYPYLTSKRCISIFTNGGFVLPTAQHYFIQRNCNAFFSTQQKPVFCSVKSVRKRIVSGKPGLLYTHSAYGDVMIYEHIIPRVSHGEIIFQTIGLISPVSVSKRMASPHVTRQSGFSSSKEQKSAAVLGSQISSASRNAKYAPLATSIPLLRAAETLSFSVAKDENGDPQSKTSVLLWQFHQMSHHQL